MRCSSLFIVMALLNACADRNSDARRIADDQAKSAIGPVAAWKLDPALAQPTLQAMRNRAYAYCMARSKADTTCLNEQDHSLFEYANAFRLVRIFRSDPKPKFRFAVAHKRDPTLIQKISAYCRSAYEDAGARDARSLGPCMSAGVGGDFFSATTVD